VTDYKRTPIGELPTDWQVSKIRDLFDVETGTTPSTKKGQYWNNGNINWLTPTDLSKLNGKTHIKKSERQVTEKALKEVNLTLMPKGSIIMSTRAPVGYVAVLDEDATFNQGCKGLIPKNWEEINSDFYSYYLLSKKQMLEYQSSGSTFKELSKQRLESFKVPYFPFKEQKKIAEVLFTVDEATQLVDLAIERTERLKKGLMQKLLTEGLGHTEFKETKMGNIPKNWRIVRLCSEDICEIRGSKSINNVENVAFIPMELISDFNISVSYEIRDRKAVSSSTYCEAGDLLLAKITPSFENGKQGIVPLNIPHGFALATTEVFPLSCKKIDRLFLFYILKFSKFRQILEYSMTGTTGRQRVSKRAVERLRIPLPPLDEQKKIAKILSTVDQRHMLEVQRKRKFERIKQGFMNDLLTGKRRIKVGVKYA